MKRKDFQQLREKTVEELKELLSKLRTEAVKIRLEIKQGKTKNVRGFFTKRKEIARVTTLISEKEALRIGE